MRRKKIATKLLLALLLIFPVQMLAQEIILEGEFRPRAEYLDGYSKPLLDSQAPAFFVHQRTRLGVRFKHQKVSSKITLQDVRLWGQTSTKSDGLPIALFEGWVDFELFKGLNIKLGRQPLKYDDKRLLSPSSTSTNGLSHDLLLIKYNNKDAKVKVDFGTAYNNSANKFHDDFYTLSKKMYKTLNYLWAEKRFKKGLSLSGIFIYELLQDPENENIENQKITNFNRFTSGLNVKMYSKDFPIGFLLSGYYQFGESRELYDLEQLQHKQLSSFLLTCKLDYFINNYFTLSAGTDIYSGTDLKQKETVSNTWNKLYGSNRSFNGYMDYWKHITDIGLTDIYCLFNVSDSKNLTTELGYHYFMASTNLNAFENSIGRGLGSEIDLIMDWQFRKDAVLTVGWSTYVNSKNTNIVKNIAYDANIRFQQSAFVSLSFKPEFFKSVLPF